MVNRVGLVDQIASPSVLLPFALSASAFAVAKARFILEVKSSGTLLLGSAVAAPAENADGQGSLSPGTNTNVVFWSIVG